MKALIELLHDIQSNAAIGEPDFDGINERIHKQLRRLNTAKLVDRFLAWPLPDSVCCDLVSTKPIEAGQMDAPRRSGTNILTATEAQQMLDFILDDASESK